MKYKFILLGLLISTSFSMFCFASDINDDTQLNATGVICSRNKKSCIVGNHRIKTNGHKPLYIKDGVVCAPNRRICTNGFSWMRSNKPLY